jgi:predicted TIM-barrel fold metal-dependent hydrolase
MLTIAGLAILLLVTHLVVIGNQPVSRNLIDKKEIIDMHVHVAGIGAGESGCHVSEELRTNWRYRTYLKAFNVSEEDLRIHGDAIVFEKVSDQIKASRSIKAAVVLALDGVIGRDGELDLSQTETYVPNEFVAKESAKYSNLMFGASVNPYRHDAIQRLEDVARQGAVLIKWLPAIQHIDPSDERLTMYYEKLVELDLPLLTHAGGERSFTTANTALGDPERLRLPLSIGVKVIAAHAATTGQSNGEDNMMRLIKMFGDYSNLYADISSLTQANKLKYLPRLLKHDVHDRLVYGTDFPLINTPLVSSWYYLRHLSFRQIFQTNREQNCWDRDVLLKSALSVPNHVFSRWDKLSGKEHQTDIK